jgi:hypothetical protein
MESCFVLTEARGVNRVSMVKLWLCYRAYARRLKRYIPKE